MKKTLLSALMFLFISQHAHAGAFEETTNYNAPFADNKQTCWLTYDTNSGSTTWMEIRNGFGPEIGYAGVTMSTVNMDTTVKYNGTVLGSAFAPYTHTHVANDISNATTVGKAVLTAADAAAARTSIGAGTSSFSGAYSNLTGIPSTFTPSAHTHAAADVTSGTFALARIPTIPAANTSGFAAVATSGNKTDVGLGNVPNTDATNATNITTGTLDANRLATSGVTAATYTNATVTVDNKGRVTSASNGSGTTRTTTNPTVSTVTGTGATGFQLSSTRDGAIRCSVTIATTISLAGNATGYAVFEVAPTNSAVAGDWVEASRVTSGQTGTLVVGLTLNQFGGGMVGADVPAGYYAKLRTVNTSGTPTYTVNSCQQTLY